MSTNSIRTSIRDIAKAAIVASAESFAKLPAAEQVAFVAAALGTKNEAFAPGDVTTFILIYRLKNGLTAAGSAEHLALRATIDIPVSAWALENPPQTAGDLFFAGEDWKEVLGAVPAAARAISYDELIDSDSDEFLAAALRVELGLAGLEDYKIPSAVGPADKTMALLIDALKAQIKILRKADWFGTAPVLPERKFSLSHFDVIENEKAVAARKVKAAEKAAERRAAALAAHTAAKTAAFEVLASLARAGSISPVDFNGKPFEDVKAILGEDEFAAKPLFVEGVAPEFVLQHLLSQLALVQPTWVRETTNGDLALKDSLPKGRGTRLSRVERSARIGVYNAIDKTSVADVVAAIKAIWPEGLTGAALARNVVIPESEAEAV